MKNINRLLAAAAILLSAAACHTSEIDNPGHTDPVNPGEPGLTISASIVKTRVTYSDMDDDDMYDKGYLHQQWEEGDILFGYYDEKVTNQVILKVDYLDSEDDYNAILVPVECNGVATLKDLADLNEEVNVDLVYTGKNLKDFKDQDGILNETELLKLFDLTVDFSSQDGIRIPACMHARAAIDVDDDDLNKKSLFFKFVNDCAIIEIYSLTGIKNLGLAGDVYLKSLTVSNLVLNGKYTFGDNGFELEASEFKFGSDVPQEQDYIKSFESSDKWCVDKDGNIYYDGSTEKRYLIAVVPNNYLQEIEVSAEIYDANSGPHTFPYGSHSFESGMCYVIYKEEVVAKTVDGVYFSTVAAAFDHAAEIAEELEGDPTKYGGKNIVTLVKENITGLGDHPEPGEDGDASLMVEIDYDVTLDLNGCTLSLINADVAAKDKSECFYVDAYSEVYGTGEGHLTIKDSRSGGTIESNSASDIVTNSGIVTVNSGALVQKTDCCVVYNEGQLNVNGGELYSNEYITVDNYGTLIMNDGELHSDGHCAIWNNPSEVDSPVVSIVVNGGYIHSSGADKCNIKSQSSSSVTIYGGKLESERNRAIESQGSVVVGNSEISLESRKKIEIVTATAIYCSAGTFDMHYGDICGPIDIENTVCHIYGGYIENTNGIALKIHDGGQCTISGGKIFNQGNEAALSCSCVDSTKTTNLVIQWPIVNGLPNQARGMGIYEPLIYNSYSNNSQPLFSAINAVVQQKQKNYAKIDIKGGFFCSNVNNFYCQNYGTPLDLQSFDTFYTNTPFVILNSSNFLNPLDSKHENYNATTVGGAKVQSSNDGFDLPFGGTPGDPLTTGKMYYISKQSDSLPTMQTNSYYFDGFDW